MHGGTTDLVYYSGDDMLNLPWLSVGAAGFVSVVGHVAGDRLHEMIDALPRPATPARPWRSTAAAAGVSPAS